MSMFVSEFQKTPRVSERHVVFFAPSVQIGGMHVGSPS